MFSAYWYDFDAIGKIDILNIDAASGIPKAPPQKRKDFLCFLKGPSWNPAGTPRPTSRRRRTGACPHRENVHFHKVLNVFLN